MNTSASKLPMGHTQVLASASFIRSLLPPDYEPTVGIIGGSGLSTLADAVGPFELDPVNNRSQTPPSRLELSFEKIPGFPIPSVQGHAGKLVFGTIITRHGKKINTVVMSGRAHFYEGSDPKNATFPVRVLGALNMKILIVTNAAGGLNSSYKVGDIMIINDHISFPSLSGTYNPLLGPLDNSIPSESGSTNQRFLALSDAYDYELRRSVWQAWKSMSLLTREEKIPFQNGTRTIRERKLQEGVYAFVAGPTYETRAESRFLSNMGADVVGMSTVPEVIVARHIGLRLLGLTLVTNEAKLERAPRGDEQVENNGSSGYDISEGKASHAEVLEAGKDAAEIVKNLIVETLDLI